MRRELIIRDGKERLNKPGTSVDVLRDAALRFEIRVDGDGKLVMAMLVKDHSPLLYVAESATKVMERLLKDGITVEVKDVTE